MIWFQLIAHVPRWCHLSPAHVKLAVFWGFFFIACCVVRIFRLKHIKSVQKHLLISKVNTLFGAGSKQLIIGRNQSVALPLECALRETIQTLKKVRNKTHQLNQPLQQKCRTFFISGLPCLYDHVKGKVWFLSLLFLAQKKQKKF